MTTELDPTTTEPLGPIIIDGRRKTKVVAPLEVEGLDFPVPGGATIRLPYPARRYRPELQPVEPGQPPRIGLIERIGYAPPVQVLVDNFLASFDGSDTRAIFAAAVVAAWSMLTHRRAAGLEPIDPGRLFEMDGDDATIFVYRMVRLVGGLVDLEQDADGFYLLPVAPSEDHTQPAATKNET